MKCNLVVNLVFLRNIEPHKTNFLPDMSLLPLRIVECEGPGDEFNFGQSNFGLVGSVVVIEEGHIFDQLSLKESIKTNLNCFQVESPLFDEVLRA